ncbi:MAG: peptidoglycan-associated lipoprotein Pal [Alphaproteobacteria bacterium]|jgi:peptidoglycan-associated lipoprotein|nr:MAG: peptidoglycan-associated lipoprotein Pal [Alphaproteobacteria bacterium]
MRSLGLSLLAGASLFAAACASNPKPEPTPPPTVAEAPRPAPVAPQPIPSNPGPAGPVAGSKGDFAAKSTDRVYFDYDQYNLDDADRRALATQVTWLKQYPSTRVEVQGHADERGTRDYNIALGDRRAQSVSQYLQSQGIAAGRIQTISFGKDKPLDPGHDESAWARNRNAFSNIIVEAVS